MTRTRIALVGLGMAVTPHARGLTDLADTVEVVHAFSPSETRRRAFGEKFTFPLCDSLDTILADDSVEAVAVLSPANTHRDIAIRCARAGKHILMEKPLEITTARAEELVAACRAAASRRWTDRGRSQPGRPTSRGEIPYFRRNRVLKCAELLKP